MNLQDKIKKLENEIDIQKKIVMETEKNALKDKEITRNLYEVPKRITSFLYYYHLISFGVSLFDEYIASSLVIKTIIAKIADFIVGVILEYKREEEFIVENNIEVTKANTEVLELVLSDMKNEKIDIDEIILKNKEEKRQREIEKIKLESSGNKKMSSELVSYLESLFQDEEEKVKVKK